MFSERATADLESDLSGKAIKRLSTGFDYIETHVVIDGLNRIFGYGQWDTDVLEHRSIQCEQRTQKNGREGWVVTWYALVKLTVRNDSGELCHYTDTSCASARNPNVGDAHEQAGKSAISGALKRAARHLGRQFGLSLYGDIPPADYTPSGLPKVIAPAVPHAVSVSAVETDTADARNKLIAVINSVHGPVPITRVYQAVKVKVGKPRNMFTAYDYTEVTGIIRAHGEGGTIGEWCDLVIGDVTDAVVEPETVALVAAPTRDDIEIAHGRAWHKYGEGREVTGEDNRVMADTVRVWSNLPYDAPWGMVTEAALERMTRELLAVEGKTAAVGLRTEWRAAAVERGLIK